jgi:hypothetical protein
MPKDLCSYSATIVQGSICIIGTLNIYLKKHVIWGSWLNPSSLQANILYGAEYKFEVLSGGLGKGFCTQSQHIFPPTFSYKISLLQNCLTHRFKDTYYHRKSLFTKYGKQGSGAKSYMINGLLIHTIYG